MPHMQLVYTSTPFGFDSATLNAILFAARHYNKRDGITGTLICRDDIFLQLLEGPKDAVEATYKRIKRDGRHIDLVELHRGETEHRLFPDWDMRHDPVRSWMWTHAEVEAGAARSMSASELIALFTRIAHEPVEADEVVLQPVYIT
jgi:Sensors of blue-light using FAD